jgi:hypothetical protein
MSTSIKGGHAPLPSPRQLAELHLLVCGYRVSQAIHVVASLGIPDLIADGPKETHDLARATGTHTSALYRVLRLLAGVGLFEEVNPRQFALTSLGAGLRRDVPGSRRPWALMLLDEAEWQSWGHLLYSVRTGEAAFKHVHGMGLFDYFRQHPEAARNFDDAMSTGATGVPIILTDHYDFRQFDRIVDVGGGHGAILSAVLQAGPHLRGVLFDSADVVAGATVVLERAGVADRCEMIAGDFFKSVPNDADAYILCQIIHDWDDPRALKILKNCRAGIRASGRLLVVERVVPSDLREGLPVLHADLEMLVNLGGLQRNEAEHRALLAEAGFRLANVVPVGDGLDFTILEGVPN